MRKNLHINDDRALNKLHTKGLNQSRYVTDLVLQDIGAKQKPESNSLSNSLSLTKSDIIDIVRDYLSNNPNSTQSHHNESYKNEILNSVDDILNL